MTASIVALLIVYLVVLLYIGFRAGHRVRSDPESFFVADRQLSWLQEGLSIFSTAVPGAALLGTIGKFYSLGADFLGYAFGYSLFTPVLYWLVGSRMRRIGARYKYQTQADFMRHFFGSRALATIVSLLSIVLIVPYYSVNPIAVGETMQAFTGLPYNFGVVIFIVLSLSYALYGGLRAVAQTDVYHGILLLVFILVLTVSFILIAHGADIFSAPQNHARLAVTTGAAGVAVFLPWLVEISFTVIVSPDRALRMYSAKDDRNLMRGVLLMASTLGFASAAYYVTGLALQILTPGVTATDTAVLHGLNGYLRWLIPFFVVSVWGSSLAIASMQLLTIANLFIKDILGTIYGWLRLRRVGENTEAARPTGREVRIGRVVMVLAGAGSLLVAAGKPSVILNIVGLVFGFWTQVGVVFLFALFWRRTTSVGALSGLIVGLALTALWQWVFTRPFGITLAGSFEALFTAAVIIVVSLLTHGRLRENTEERAEIIRVGEGRDASIRSFDSAEDAAAH